MLYNAYNIFDITASQDFLNSEDKLLNDLILSDQTHYNKRVRPAARDSDAVSVKLGLDIIEFVELVRISLRVSFSLFHKHCWIFHRWTIRDALHTHAPL